MFDESADPALVARSEWITRFGALAVAALGAAVLIGAGRDIAALKGALGGWGTTHGNTAFGFVLAGLSLAAAGMVHTARGWRGVHLAPAVALTLLGLLTLGESMFAVDFGIDDLLFRGRPQPSSMDSPGRMTGATAAGFALTGMALALLDCRSARAGSRAAACAFILICPLVITGYAYGAVAFFSVDMFSGVALHTAIGFMVVKLGVLLVGLRRGMMAVVASKSAGSVMARRLLPLALIAFVVIGWLLVQGQRSGFYSDEFGVAAAALTLIAVFTAYIWRTAEVLHHGDWRGVEDEGAWRPQQAQVNGIVDSAMDAIVMVDAAHRVVRFNPAAEQIFGRRAADVLGGPLDVLLPERIRSVHCKHVSAFAASAMTNRRLGGLLAITGLRANGEEFPVEASISQLEANGEKYFTMILRDFTENRRVQEALGASEARLKLAMEVAKIGTWERELATGAGVWSAQTGVILGLDADRYTFEDFVRRIHPADMRRVREALAAPLAGEPFDLEYRIVRPSGEIRWVNERGQVICDARGNPEWVLGAALDVTERRATEDALRASKAEAERANNAKSRFLAAASHDLRQPLSALSIYVNVLRGHVAPGGQPLLANLNDCIASLSELLTDLLDLSKLEAGVVTPNPSDFPIAEALAGLISVHSPEAELKGLRLPWVASRLTAHTDLVLFRRILGNLIENAIRYTERGGVLVGCRRRCGKTWVEVWDTGIGIPEDQTGEIFEEFRQLGDGARTRGSGLGLAIVAKTATLLGLEVSVRSRPGSGSVFAVELPLGREQVAPAPGPSKGAYRSLRIALVEDNLMLRQALVHALQDAGHQVVAAATAAEFRAQLGSLTPDVVVSDYRLGQGETGFDVITAARAATRPDLPAILITGDTDPKLMRSMADRGIVVLHKPLDQETLQAYLQDLQYQDEVLRH